MFLGGKSSVTKLLQQALGPRVKTYNQDHYYHNEDFKGHVVIPDLKHINWELEKAFNNQKLFDEISETDKSFRGPSKIASPDFLPIVQALQSKPANHFVKDNEVTSETLDLFSKISPHIQLQLVEGITVLESKILSEICDLKVFIKLDHSSCAARRQKRTYDPPDPEGYFEAIVWPAYLDQLKIIQGDPNVHFIEGTKSMEEIFVKTLKLIVDILIKHHQ